MATHRNIFCPRDDQRLVPLGPRGVPRLITPEDSQVSDLPNDVGNISSGIKSGEEEVDDSGYEHDCCRAVRKSSPPVKFQGIRSR